MSTRLKVLLITLAVAIPAFLSARIIWPPNPSNPVPTATQLPFFILLSALEALLLGLGVAFLIFGFPLVRRVTGGRPILTWATFLAIAWLMVSWWSHDSMHLANGMDLGGLLVIEYLYHFTLMVAGVVLGYAFFQWLSAGAVSSTTAGD